MSSPPTAGTLLCPTAPARPTRLLRLQANQAIRLDDPARVLLVRQGGLHVLSCRFRQGSPLGERRHLFELAAGQAAFGCAAGEEDGLSLLALALAQTELEEHSLDDLAKLLAGDAAARALVDGWVARVGPLLSGGSPASAALLQPEEPGELELLGKEQLAPAPAPHRTCWLRVRSGSLALHGDAALLLTAQHGFCLLAASCWVQALTEVVQLGSWWSEHPPGAAPPLAEALGNLHRLLLADQWRQREFERRQRAERRVASARHEQAEARRAMRELASLLDPQPRFEVQQSPLLTALTVVGQAQGITIEPPGRWEEPSRQSDPLAATARASRIRYRRVLLEPGWQDSDSGPLLAFLADDGEVGGRPVALLRGSRGCQLVDPADLQPRPLSAALAARLRPDAYMLYRPLPEELHGLGGMLRHLLRHRLGDLLFALGLVTLATLLALVVPRATATLIDAAIPQADRPLLWQLALILAGATLGQVLFTWVQAMTAIRMSTATQLLAQTGMWDRLLKLRPSFFRRYSAGDLGSRVGALGEVARQLDAAALRPLLSGSLSCLNLLLLLYYSPTLAAFAVLVGLLVLAVTLSSAVVIRKRSLRYQELAGRFGGLVVQLIGGVARLRVCGAEQRAFFQWAGRYAEQLAVALSIQRVQDAVSVFETSLPALCSAILFYLGAGLVLGGTEPASGAATGGAAGAQAALLSMGGYLACSAAFFLFLRGISELSTTLVNLLEITVKAERIWPILGEAPEMRQTAADPGRLAGRICLERVSFRYAEDGPLALDDVSLEIGNGRFVALVGPSGSGKSTLLRLLLGFDRPQQGRVLYDGQDLAGLDIVALRRQIGTVLQHGRVNAGSLLENIALGSRPSQAEVWEAITDAGLRQDVEAMPMGLHTVVSEGGTNLSGGQRQRLLIARALVTRPRLVFFDEATSALDNRTQAIVSASLRRRKVTRVVVAHRLSTIRHADCIFVLDQGRLVQQGTFDELAGQEGLFRQLVARQMA